MRATRTGFVLQALAVPAKAGRPPRYGFTVTRKVGNAVVRNRIRRRLREAVRLVDDGAAGTDYVLVGRRAALTLHFDRLLADLRSGLAALSAPGATESRSGRNGQ